jgi:hypothetical protein
MAGTDHIMSLDGYQKYVFLLLVEIPVGRSSFISTLRMFQIRLDSGESESDLLKDDVPFLRIHQPSTGRPLSVYSMKDPVN